MNESRIVVGIDIGTSKIVTIIAKIDDAVNVLGVSEVKSQGIKKGQIVDIEEAVAAVNTSLESAERMAGYSVSRVVASIGGSHIESQNSKGVVAVARQDGEIVQNDVDRVIDAARAISLSTTREIIHVLPRSYTVNGQHEIKDPIGMNGVRLEVDTHIVTSNSTSLRNLEKALADVGVDVSGIVFSGLASSLAVLTDTEKELGVVLVDIGAGTTDISVYVDGSVAYSSVLAIGARHISNDLAIGLRLSLESAEKIKLYLSQSPKKVVHPFDIDADEEGRKKEKTPSTDEVDLASLNLSEEIKKVSRKTLVDGIIKPRLNEIFTMVGIELKKSGFGGQTPAGIVVTGGGANTIGVVDCAKRMLAMPVRVGIPIGIKGIVDEVQDTPYATGIGLIVYGATHEQEKTSLPLGFSMPSVKFMPTGKIFHKIVSFIKSFIP